MAEKIIQKSLGLVMKPRYRRYALSVIKDRALPNITDGTKPVMKRILYAMHELGLKSNSKHKKAARVVGEAMGKYHPHGDASIYEAAVRASQDWSLRYPLVDLQGNNGSRDGDSPAAMRYTEVRLTPIGEALLNDIHKNTVTFIPNFDDTEQEPLELPTMLPMLLANGVEGIAVSLSTSIPPHNLTELLNASQCVINNTLQEKETTLQEVMTHIKGPDFPTGGTIINNKELKKIFTEGRGKIVLRGTAEIIDLPKGHKGICITELPYQVKPIDFLAKVEKLRQDNKIEGIKDIENQCQADNIRLVIILKKDANASLILNQLYKQTDLQKNVSYNTNVLVEEEPVQITLMDYLNAYLSHSLDVLLKRTEYDLNKNNKRLDYINAIFKAIENIDEVIQIQRTAEEPIKVLMERLEIAEEQAKYIDDSKLRTLVRPQLIEKLQKEHEELSAEIAEQNKIINDEAYSLEILSKELEVFKNKFGDERRTKIDTTQSGEITDEDLIKDEPLVVTVTSDGLIKAVEEKEYSTQKRGGKGTKTASTKDDEIVTDLFSINSKDDILFMTDTGRCHKLKGYQIPKVSKAGKGKHVNNFIKLEAEENVVSIMSLNLREEADSSILFVTALGQIKRLAVKDLSSRYSALKALTIKEGDALQTCLKIKEGEDVLIATAHGQSIRFTVSETSKKPVKPQGRTASGVQGIKVAEGDYVIGATVINNDSNILTLTAHGLSKQTKGATWEAKLRAGKGIVCHKITDKTGELVSILSVTAEDELFVATESGKIIRLAAADIATSGRATAGSKAIKLDANDYAFTASLAPITNYEEEVEEEA